MKPKFVYLSYILYKNIHDTFKYKCNSKYNYDSIHNETRLERYKDKAYYYDNGIMYEDLSICYDGFNKSVFASKITMDYLLEQNIKSNNKITDKSISNTCAIISNVEPIVKYPLFDNIEVYYHDINVHQAFTDRSQCEHMFLKARLKDNLYSDKYIIDPTYKQLFIKRYGDIRKFYSLYAEYLYRLPPVFIGTEDELETLKFTLDREKKFDFYHENDNYLDVWHKEAKEFDPIKLNKICEYMLA